MNNNAIFKKNLDIVCRKISGESVLIPVKRKWKDHDNMYSLNRLGSHIWSKLDGKTDFQQIVSEISLETATEKSIVEKDCGAFLKDLQQEGLIEKL